MLDFTLKFAILSYIIGGYLFVSGLLYVYTGTQFITVALFKLVRAVFRYIYRRLKNG